MSWFLFRGFSVPRFLRKVVSEFPGFAVFSLSWFLSFLVPQFLGFSVSPPRTRTPSETPIISEPKPGPLTLKPYPADPKPGARPTRRPPPNWLPPGCVPVLLNMGLPPGSADRPEKKNTACCPDPNTLRKPYFQNLSRSANPKTLPRRP